MVDFFQKTFPVSEIPLHCRTVEKWMLEARKEMNPQIIKKSFKGRVS